jgi:small GTP-binding protein
MEKDEQVQTQEPKKETEEGEYEILREDFPKFDLSFKIIVIGDAGVGKSCLSLQATKRRFESNYLATIGVESFTFVMRYKDKIIRMQILDTCGQEIYKSLISNFYRNSSLAIIVYAIDE